MRIWHLVLGLTLPVTVLVASCLSDRVVAPEEELPAILAIDRPTVQLFRFAMGRRVAADTVRISNNGEGTLGPVRQVGGVDYQQGRTGWLRTTVVNVGPNEALLILEPLYAEEEQEEADIAEVVLQGAGSSELRWVTVYARTLRGASFEFSVSPLAFAAGPGESPTSQVFTVRNGGNGTLVIHPPEIRYEGEAADWLAVTQAGGSGTAPVFEVRGDPSGLAGGLHKAQLVFESLPGEQTRAKPASLNVFLDVGQPRLGLSAPTLGFTVVRGETPPTPQSIRLSNVGAGGFSSLGTVEVGDVAYGSGYTGWLSATLDDGRIQVTADPGNFPAGDYTATFPIHSDHGGSRNVQVTLSVEAPIMTPSAQSLSFGMVRGEDGLPTAQVVRITNTGSGTAASLGEITLGALLPEVPWVTAAVQGRELTVTPTAGAATLPVGSHVTRIPVHSTFGGSDTVTVTLAVSPGTDGAVLVLSASEVSFSGIRGNPSPPPQALQISNAGGGSLGGVTLGAIAYQGTEGWLAASLADTVLTLSAETGSLPPGSHLATVPVRSDAGGNASVTATFTVASPTLTASASSASFSAPVGGVAGETREIALSNTGPGGFSALGSITLGAVSYGNGAGWLQASLSGATLTLTLASVPAAAGVYSASVPLTSEEGGSLSITADLTVVPQSNPPVLALSSSSAFFTAPEGGENPNPQSVFIFNGGGGRFADLGTLAIQDLTYGPGASDWLQPTRTDDEITLALTTDAISAGSYSAGFTISSSEGGSERVTVTLHVSGPADPPALGLGTDRVDFVSLTGGDDPPPRSIPVFNTGSDSLGTVGLGAIAYEAGASGWLDGSSFSGETLTLQATAGSLASGTYSATVEVTSEFGGNGWVSVSVQVLAPALTAQTRGLSFSGETGGSNPPAQSVSFSNSGAGGFADLGAIVAESVDFGSGPTGWLTAPQPGSPVVGSSLGFSVSTGGLASGVYTAAVIVASERGGSQTVGVTLSVVRDTEPPRLVVSATTQRFGALVGGPNPEPQSVLLSNGGGGSLGQVRVGPPTYGPGATGWLEAALAGDVVQVQARTGLLAEGTYTASLPVASDYGGTESVAVTFVVGSPRLTVAPRAVSLWDTLAGRGPEPVTVSLANTGGGTFSSLGTLSVEPVGYGEGAAGWLTAVRTGQSLVLSAQTGGLGPRSTPYQARVAVTSVYGGGDTVAVAFTVAPGASPPRLALSADSLTFSGILGGEDPAPQTVMGFNAGGSSLGPLAIKEVVYTGPDRDWLQTSVSGTTLTLQPRLAMVGPGLHGARVRVASEYGGELELAVDLDVARPILSLSSQAITFSDTVASPDTLRSQVFLSNTGGGTRSHLGALTLGTVSYPQGGTDWLRTIPTPGETVEGFVVAMEGVAARVPEGTSVALVPVESQWGGSDTVRVTFTSRRPDRSFDLPTIELVRDTVLDGITVTLPLAGDSVVVVAEAGTSAQIGVRLGVRNASETRLTLSGLRVSTPTYPQGQVGGWITGAFLDRTSATFSRPAELFVVVAPGGLARGRYEGRLVVSSETVGLEQVASRTLRLLLLVQ